MMDDDLLFLSQIIQASRRPLVFTPEEPKRPETRYDRYLRYIDSIAPAFNDFGDGWGGDDTPRQMAMKLHPYEEWDGD